MRTETEIRGVLDNLREALRARDYALPKGYSFNGADKGWIDALEWVMQDD